MSHVRTASGWKGLVTGTSVRTASGWKAVTEIHSRTASGWKLAWQARSLVAGISPTSYDTDTTGNNVTVGVRFNNDGTYDRLNNGVWAFSGNWINPPTTANAADFEIQVTEAGDTAAINVAVADGSTWYDLGTTRTFQDILTVTNATENFTFIIREKADTGNSQSGSFSLQTEVLI